MSNKILMTAEGYERLRKELDELRTVKRKEISEKIRIARGFGDLSENSEYDEAKNEQAIVEAKIALLEEQVKNAKIIETGAISTEVASIGVSVTLLDMEFEETMKYRISSAVEAHHSSEETIADESPVGRAVIGRRVGDVVDVIVPSGHKVQYKILEIAL